jgi:hypothetical protein
MVNLNSDTLSLAPVVSKLGSGTVSLVLLCYYPKKKERDARGVAIESDPSLIPIRIFLFWMCMLSHDCTTDTGISHTTVDAFEGITPQIHPIPHIIQSFILQSPT